MSLQNERLACALKEMGEGSVEAFDVFYSELAPFIMQVAMKTIGDRMEAEDICHEVFLEALRKGQDYDAGRGSIKAWMAVMTRSRCLDRLRRKQRVVPTQDCNLEFKGRAASGEDMALARLEREAVKEAVISLPISQRKAIIGSYFFMQTQRQMSDAWNVPLGTVKSWMRYGLGNLRKQLEKQGWMAVTEGSGQDGHESAQSTER